MFRNTDIQKTDGTYQLTAGTFMGGIHTNPLSRIKGQADPCLLYADEKIQKVQLQARARSNNTIMIDFGQLQPVPVAELAFSLKEKALDKVKLLWKAVQAADIKELPLSAGLVPLYSIFFVDEDKVVFLSGQYSETVSFSNEDSFNFASTFALSWVPFNKKIKLAEEMVQLLYYSQTGVFPFASADVRNTRAANFLPLSLGKTENSLAGAIDKALRLKGDKAVLDLDALLSGLSWSVTESTLDTPEAREYLQKTARKARTRIFWKKKGWMIAGGVAVLAFIGYFTANYLYREFGPPSSAGMDQEGVVMAYYQAQNDLDAGALTDALVHGVKSPVYNEVIGLYVNKATRMGYEMVDSIVSPEDWIASGRQPIDDGGMIYGVTDVTLDRVDDDTLRATAILYSGYDYFSDVSLIDTEVDKKEADVFVYTQVEEFDLVKKNYWYEISRVETISLEPLEFFEVPYRESTSQVNYQTGSLEGTF